MDLVVSESEKACCCELFADGRGKDRRVEERMIYILNRDVKHTVDPGARGKAHL